MIPCFTPCCPMPARYALVRQSDIEDLPEGAREYYCEGCIKCLADLPGRSVFELTIIQGEVM